MPSPPFTPALTTGPAGNGKRHVMVNLTPWANDDASSRWITCWSATPVQALRRVLELIDRSAGQVLAKRTWRGDVVILDHRAGQPASPLAFVAEDLTLDDVRAALLAIRSGALK